MTYYFKCRSSIASQQIKYPRYESGLCARDLNRMRLRLARKRSFYPMISVQVTLLKALKSTCVRKYLYEASRFSLDLAKLPVKHSKFLAARMQPADNLKQEAEFLLPLDIQRVNLKWI